MEYYPLYTHIASSVPRHATSVQGALAMADYCFCNSLFSHISTAHSIAWVRMQSVVVSTILQCEPVSIAGSWRAETDIRCTKLAMELVESVPEVDAGTRTGLTSRVDEVRVCDGTVMSPYHIRSRTVPSSQIQVQGHSWLDLLRCEVSIVRLASKQPSLSSVAWHSDFSASTVRAPLSRHLTPSEIAALATHVDHSARLIECHHHVVVCVHVIIHGVAHLSGGPVLR